MLVCLLYSCLLVTCADGSSSLETGVGLDDDDNNNDENGSTAYNYCMYHVFMALAAMFMAMQLSGWVFVKVSAVFVPG